MPARWDLLVAASPDVILNTINGDSNVAPFRALRAAGVKSDAVPTISFSITEQELSSLSSKDIVGDYPARNCFHSGIDNLAFLCRDLRAS